jgi:O-antigen ligase
MIYFAAGLYALVLWIVALRRPNVALALIFATAPLQNDLSSGGPVKFSIAEINLILTVPILIFRAPRFIIGAIVWPVGLYFGICAVSSSLHWHPTTLACFMQMALYLIIAITMFASLPRDADDLRLAFNGLICVGILLSLAVVIARSSYVLGLHKNSVGSSLAASLLVALELWFAAEPGKRRRNLTVALAIIGGGLLASLSRGAWLGAICGTAVLLVLRRQFGLFFRAAILLVPVIALLWQCLPAESRETATGFDRSHRNIEARFQSVAIARGYFEQDPILGDGVGLRKEYDATSIAWVTLAETGVLGAGAFALIHLTFFGIVWRARKLIPREDEIFSLLAIGAALVINRLAHGLVDHYWTRGALMLAWAGGGMATFAAWEGRRRMRAGGYDDEEDEDEADEAEPEEAAITP